ncbi:MAG TPA: DNA-processing protein DprA [Candidatus Kapabacteria bacterium]|nr:DNA-processing protein DprA [Candidatus Kapabacteria bacterium]
MNKRWTNKDLIQLSILKNFKSLLFRQIVEKYDSFTEFNNSELSKQIFQDSNKDSLSKLNELADIQLQKMIDNDSRLISIWDEEYPQLLRQTSSPPPMIFVKGKIYNDRHAIAIVGTRKATAYGRLTSERFAEYLVANNIVVISGLAYGVDTISHLSAVRAGGITYAVLPSSIDTISPSTSKKYAEKIVESGGALISEYRFGVPANLGSFPQRNRIIAGVSLATIVVECGLKSGALITAKIANSESREVFAVPGNINSSKSDGTNKLIKDNLAIIAISPESVLEELGINKLITEKNNSNSSNIRFDDEAEAKLYNILNFEPLHIDSITELLDIDFSDLSSALLMLEFKGHIKQLPGKYYLRTHL